MLEHRSGSAKALLTHSCTAALEMAALLSDLEPGDEVIMPSFTFVSTANAFVLRGARPVFVDVRPDTLNIDEALIEARSVRARKRHRRGALRGRGLRDGFDPRDRPTARAGGDRGCSAGLLSTYNGRPPGSLGDRHPVSTKPRTSSPERAGRCSSIAPGQRAEVIREKGTNRSQFFRGQVDKYTWVDVGSSFLPGELMAAFLWAQMEQDEKSPPTPRALGPVPRGVCRRERGHMRRPSFPRTAGTTRTCTTCCCRRREIDRKVVLCMN